jgi:hypothetical protein
MDTYSLEAAELARCLVLGGLVVGSTGTAERENSLGANADDVAVIVQGRWLCGSSGDSLAFGDKGNERRGSIHTDYSWRMNCNAISNGDL